MARILFVGDQSDWRDAVEEALVDHHVDLAAGQESALVLLRTAAPYDLAVVDLHQASSGDNGGGDGLPELLWSRYPDTRRVIVAAAPPTAASPASIFAKYGVEEVLVRSEISAVDLRRVVEEALDHEAAVEARIRRAELRRRYQDWRQRHRADLDARIRTAQIVVRNIGEVHRTSRWRADAALQNTLAERERFIADVYDIGSRIERAVTVLEILDATDALGHVEERYADVLAP